MGDCQSYEKVIELSNEYKNELQPYIAVFDNIQGYKFEFETKGQYFHKYIIFIRLKKNTIGKNAIYINVKDGYRGSVGADYFPVFSVHHNLLNNQYIHRITHIVDTIRDDIYSINNITFKFIDLIQDYQPLLYKLLVYLKM